MKIKRILILVLLVVVGGPFLLKVMSPVFRSCMMGFSKEVIFEKSETLKIDFGKSRASKEWLVMYYDDMCIVVKPAKDLHEFIRKIPKREKIYLRAGYDSSGIYTVGGIELPNGLKYGGGRLGKVTAFLMGD